MTTRPEVVALLAEFRRQGTYQYGDGSGFSEAECQLVLSAAVTEDAEAFGLDLGPDFTLPGPGTDDGKAFEMLMACRFLKEAAEHVKNGEPFPSVEDDPAGQWHTWVAICPWCGNIHGGYSDDEAQAAGAHSLAAVPASCPT